MEYFKSPSQFRERMFGAADMSHLDPLDFIDDSIGFSIKRRYPNDCRYRPPVTRDGEPDTVALIRVLYLSPDRHSEVKRLDKVPLIIDISAHSMYLFKHRDYNFEDPDCPTQESLMISKKTPAPISLEYTSEYFYDHSKESVVDRDGTLLSGQKIVETIFNQHCNTTRPIIEAKYRIKLRSRAVHLRILEGLLKFTLFVLKKGFGRSFEMPENSLKGLAFKYDARDMRFLSTNKIEFFGYKASINVIVTFCFLVVLGFTVAHVFGYTSDYVDTVAASPLLALCFSILVLAVLDNMLPMLIFRLINWLIDLRLNTMMKKIRF